MFCYFCNTKLSAFIDKDNSGNYSKHYCCYKCLSVKNPAYGLDAWKNPYHVIAENDNEISVSYLYFHKLKLWLHIFHWGDNGFMDIKNESNDCLFRLKSQLNPFNYQPDVLENKVKAWVIFS